MYSNSKYKIMKDLNLLTVRLLKAEFHICTDVTKKKDLALVDMHPKDSFCYDAISLTKALYNCFHHFQILMNRILL